MSKKISLSKKIAVAEKCNWRCAYCGKDLDFETLRLDHVTPKAKGGGNGVKNLLPCCNNCNSKKGTLDLESFRLRFSFQNCVHGISFTTEQIRFLKENNVFELWGIDLGLFYFETIGVSV